MDPLTHALSGALLARATAQTPLRNRYTLHSTQVSRQPASSSLLPLRLQVITGLVAAVFPDIDFALRLIDTLTYLNWHQGPTHSLVMLPLWAWLLAHLLSFFSHHCYGWRPFFQPACLGLAVHIAVDLITSYGLMLFAPFSIERYTLSLIFVIDPWFSLMIILGLLVSWFYPKQRIGAIIAMAGLIIYIIFLWTLHEKAVAFAKNHADAQALAYEHINVLPQPLSPFHWKIIIRQGDNYHVALINLWQTPSISQADSGKWLLSRMAAAYQPVTANNWQLYKQFGDNPTLSGLIQEAWRHPSFKPFRSFAEFPVLEYVEYSEKRICFWFYDMRFKFPALPPSFRYGICRQQDPSVWKMQRHRGLFYID